MNRKVMTFLLVEDDRVEQEKFKAYLAQHPELLCLGIAETAAEALELTLALRPQAVILDIELRESSGFEYVEQLNARNLKERPAVMALTNITGDATRKSMEAKGTEGLITKSDSRYLRAGVRYVFDRLWELEPFFAVRPDAAGRLPGMDAQESAEARWQRVENYCELRGAAPVNKQTSYVVATVVRLMEHPQGNFTLKELLLEAGLCERFGRDCHTITQGMRECLTNMWDRGGELSLREEYAAKHPVDAAKGMPDLKRVLLYMADRLRGIRVGE